MSAYEVIPAHELELLTIKWHVLERTDKGYIEQPGDYYAQPVIGFWIVGDEPGNTIRAYPIIPGVGPFRLGTTYALRRIGSEKIYADEGTYDDATKWFAAVQQRFPQLHVTVAGDQGAEEPF
jgi:hypothetical protein